MTKKKAKEIKDASPAKDHAALMAKIRETLMENLTNIPMSQWQEPIVAAIQSAYNLGAGVAKGAAEGEDRVLEKGDSAAVDDVAHDIMMSLGRMMANAGIRPEHVRLRCDAVTTKGNEQYFSLTTTLPPAVAARFLP